MDALWLRVRKQALREAHTLETAVQEPGENGRGRAVELYWEVSSRLLLEPSWTYPAG